MPGNKSVFTLRLGSNSHQSITENAIKAIDDEFFSITELTNSMKKAIEEIANANDATDDDEFSYAVPHFDGEMFTDSQFRIKVSMTTARDALEQNDVKRAVTPAFMPKKVIRRTSRSARAGRGISA